MGRSRQIAIRMPAVALHDAGIVVTDHRRRLRQPAAGQDRVDGGVRRDPDPQPLQAGVDAPARLIHRHDGTAADGRAQGGVGRLRLARRAVEGVDQPAARHRQPEAVAQQRRDFAVGEAAAFVEEHGEGDRLRSQLHGGRAERIRRLQRMAPLHATAALQQCPICTSKRRTTGRWTGNSS